MKFKRCLLMLMSFCLLLSSKTFVQAEEISRAALGVTLTEDQRKETLEILGASQLSNDHVFEIDGNMVNAYLKDGSDSSTDILSSAYIELKPEGYGVQVQILTPDNITQVSESMYQSAAITAGAHNVLIKIASVQPVTGEGALTGLYSVFEQAGFALDQTAIDTAEKQLSLEQHLAELTDLSKEEISKLINEINIAVIESLSNGEEINEEKAEELVKSVLSDLEIELSEEAIELLIEHTLVYAESPAASDALTQKTIEQSTKETIIGKSFISGDIEVTFDDIYFTEDREDHLDSFDHVLVIEYTLKNNHDEEYYTGLEFDVYVNGHKADDYFGRKNKEGPVSPTRTISVATQFGFNGDKDEIELELRDSQNYEIDPVIIPVDNIRDESEVEESDESEEVVGKDQTEKKVSSISIDDLELVEKNEGELLVPGEYKNDAEFGTMTLLKINNEEEEFQITDDLEVTIHSVKIFDIQDPDQESPLIKDLELEEHDYTMQIVYTIKNNSDTSYENANIDRVIFSDGEQVNRTIFFENEPFSVEGGAKVSNAVIVMKLPSPDLTGATLSINYLMNAESFDIETNPMEIKF